ncbi:MAG TPA: RNA 2',3'-cyclic phosphodiesterase [Steroidobacter sp.]|uniref:RNA 2',3'-cyclic phosphodiesterase n=1 Tax=Steroidobacter sp. TaxID=1978227 RepID=UPI002EDA659A
MGAGRRLFLALWPTDEFRAQIQASTLAIARASGGRLIPPQNYHVTLLFLGEVPAESVGAIQEASARLAGSPAFELRFDCIEAWGRKLLCLTSSTPPAAASDLAAGLRSSLSSYVQRPEAHEFRPHITLARDLARGRRSEKIDVLCQKVADFALVESVRDASGSQYSLLARWPLS